ncbi:hypothetical protein U1Q18_040910 [Sarracenia purpurea var. burkii]
MEQEREREALDPESNTIGNHNREERRDDWCGDVAVVMVTVKAKGRGERGAGPERWREPETPLVREEGKGFQRNAEMRNIGSDALWPRRSGCCA